MRTILLSTFIILFLVNDSKAFNIDSTNTFFETFKNTSWVAKNPSYSDTVEFSAKSYKYHFYEGLNKMHLKLDVYADFNDKGEAKIWEGYYYKITNDRRDHYSYHSVNSYGQMANGELTLENSNYVNRIEIINSDGTGSIYKDEIQFINKNEFLDITYTKAENGDWEEIQKLKWKKMDVDEKKGRVTSLGGIFFKSKNPTKLKKWYRDNLGLDTDEWGTNFMWKHHQNPNNVGYTQWSPFIKSTSYFKPSDKDFMINYRVVDIEVLVEKLRVNGVEVLDKLQSYDYGKFIHILDVEGNKIELWEPIDKEYSKFVKGKTY